MLFHELVILRFISTTLIILLFGYSILNAAEPVTTSSSEDFSSVEERRLHVRIIEEQDTLIQEKKALVLEETRLEKLKTEIDAKLAEIDHKLVEMEAQKKVLEALLSQKQEGEQQRIKNLGKIYENMDPILAAEAVADLDPQVAAAILAAMKPRSAARILNVLSREQATEISRLFLAMPAQ
ncbi:MAG: MotE family protein [Desulfocapsaceae bacterium]